MSPADPTDGFELFEGGAPGRWLARWPPVAPIVASARRRALLLGAVCWIPLAVLSFASGLATDGVSVPFLADFEVHARFLLALPLLIFAEEFAHRIVGPMLRSFVSRDIVREPDRPRLAAIYAAATRWNLSPWTALLLAAIVVLLGREAWSLAAEVQEPAWFGTPGQASTDWTSAGLWLRWVALPIFQFVLLRWCFRIVLWTILLLRVARLDLHLVPTHPDCAAGLGFFDNRIYAFSPLLSALGCLYSGILANRILHEGGHLPDYRYELAGAAALAASLVLVPLCVFMPRMIAARHDGKAEFARFASRYVLEFESRWLKPTGPAGEKPLGSADIRSLADLGVAFGVVKRMRVVPFTLRSGMFVAACVLGPVLPLALTIIPVDELAKRLLQFVV